MNKDEEKENSPAKNVYDIIHGIITTTLVPFAIYMMTELKETKKELTDYKVTVTAELGQKVYRADLDRLENKIDNLRDLVINEIVKRKQ